MDRFKFSFIIPTYNCERKIVDCITSIFQQEYKDFEIIVQDGGSTDSTVEQVNELKKSHPEVSMIIRSEKDDGIYDAMNKAVNLSSGTWLYFLGSDDSLYDEKVLGKVELFSNKSPHFEMVYGNVYRIHSREIHFGKFDFEKLLIHNICHQSMFLKKSLFLLYGPFDLRYAACADWDFNLKLYKSKVTIGYLPIIVAYYNEQGFSNTFRDKLFFEKLTEERKRYLSKWDNYIKSIFKRVRNRAAKQLPFKLFGDKLVQSLFILFLYNLMH
ncbi:MAG: glycosyltransferase family 2 protein [Chitinophagaceae bacterium]